MTKTSTRPVPRTFNPEAPRQPSRLPPGGEEPKPWPEWHLRTFVNEWLLREDPIETRDALFLNHYRDQSWWLEIDNLLHTIEREAKRVLKENPPPFNVDDLLEVIEQQAKIGVKALKEDLNYLTEEHFYHCFSQANFTPGKRETQASAIAALRGIHVIWQLTGAHYDGSGTRRTCDPAQEENYDSITASRIAMEMALVMANAVRGEFLEVHAPLIERGAAAIRGARSKRDDNLNKAIIQELQEHGLKQSALKILAEIEKKAKLDNDEIVYEVTDDHSICWFDERTKARETHFHAFEKRVSKLKKRFLPSK